jgi:hypothetical protein
MPPDAEEWQPMLPPTGAKPEDFPHPEWGQPSGIWECRNRAGLLEGYVCRFETVRTDGTPSKEFRPLRWGVLVRKGKARTGWHWRGWGLGRPLYGLCELLARPDAMVIVTEGEKVADAARRLFPKSVAVASMNGAMSPHKTDWAQVAGRTVVIWPNNDEAGLGFARACARLVTDSGAGSTAIVAIPPEWPAGWDLADELPHGVDIETVAAMLANAVPWGSAAPDHPQPPAKQASEAEIEAAVLRLTACSAIQRELQIKAMAKSLGIRVLVLERLVKAEQGETAGSDGVAPGQGRPVEIHEVEPWPGAVDGVALLDELAAALHSYVTLSDPEADATALWLVRTHAHAAFDFNPPLRVRSVEKRSGKTRLCEVVDRVAAKPLLVSSVSPSALLRVVETNHPTVILDELDALLKKSPEMAEAFRGLMSSSFERSAARHLMSVPVPGGGYEVREFSMWAPVLLSGIGVARHRPRPRDRHRASAQAAGRESGAPAPA